MHDVKMSPRSLRALTAVLPPDQASELEAAVAQVREVMAGRRLWNVSATETGGGVAEMLRTLLGYLIAAGVEARWLVLDGNEEFFATTKCLHNAVHGLGSPEDLGPGAHADYRRTLEANMPALLRQVRRQDLVLLHDPQSAGLLQPVKDGGVRVAWRSHIGRDVPNEQSVAAWEFLRAYVEQADAFVFSRSQHAPGWVPPGKLWIIPPSIDPLATKNRQMSPEESCRVLCGAGLLATNRTAPSPTIAGGPPPRPDARLIVQVSRWDRLKDMAGVMAAFGRADLPEDVHLMLAGPAVTGVTDDPEGAAVLGECLAKWQCLPDGIRDRVSLVSVPMDDVEQNATIVNALQQHATVVTQKSLAEGFGLTVAEAMWKSKPMVASAVGGIQDQITDGQDGLLIEDPTDLDAFASALRRLMTERELPRLLAGAAHRRVVQNFLDDRQVVRSTQLLSAMVASHN
jgi:trehalose synthase